MDLAKDIGELVLIMAGMVTAFVVIRGLNAWRREYKSKTYFEFARRLMQSVYSVRDGMSYVRRPFIGANENLPGWSALPNEKITQRDRNKMDADNLAHIFNNRYENVQSDLDRFAAMSLEAEVLLGKEARRKCNDLSGYIGIHKSLIETKIHMIVAAGPLSYEQEERYLPIYSQGSDDQWDQDFNEAIESLENDIRKYLDRFKP